MTELTTSETLNRAADLIEERGWTQGYDGWGDSLGRTQGLCLEGGLIAAAGVSQWELYAACPAYTAVTDYLALTPQPVTAPIKDTLWGWNDSVGRTASEVIETLRACAVIEASREQAAAEVSA